MVIRPHIALLVRRQRERIRYLGRVDVTDSRRRTHLFRSMEQLDLLRSATEMPCDGDRRVQVHSDALYAPVFVLGAGWRSGSTLLARLLSTPRARLMWGEPYHYSDVLLAARRIIESITDDWPPEEFIVSAHLDSLEGLSHTWIANLFPTPDDLIGALQDFYISLFGQPAVELGFESWGVKEVHLSGLDAAALHYLFPRARFIFLVRNPVDAWQSYRAMGASWRFTDRGAPVGGAIRFARMWTRQTNSFLDTSIENAIVVRYEDLVSEQAIARIESFLDERIDRSAIEQRIGSSHFGRQRRFGNARVRLLTWRARRRLGYI